MSLKMSTAQAIALVILLGGLVVGVRRFEPVQTGSAHPVLASESTTTQIFTFLPAIINRYPWMSPFGVETSVDLSQNSAIYQRAVELHPGWVRMNGRISWRKLQPTEGGPIAWNTLGQFENELHTIRSLNMTPLVIVDDYPYWAVQIVRKDGKPSSCGPLKAEKFPAFAQFMRELVRRYHSPEFNVHNWELGNEPDVDPDLVPVDSPFGCWGDIDDPYYGGANYGEMLKAAAPAIRAEDPAAQIWLGGLLLATPQTQTGSGLGTPESFLEGILRAGAASSFDVVPYHWYPSYQQITMDYDLGWGTSWEPWGGGTVGKARFLRNVMQGYNVSKPLSLNETGLGCPNDWTIYDWCVPPGPDAQFFQLQADYVIRSFTRGYNEGVTSMIWYTLEGPGWRYTGLLDGYANPKPVYLAYQNLIAQLQNTHKLGPINYGAEIEAYAFQRWHEQVQIVWTIADTYLTVPIPQAKFKAAYTWNGAPINPTLENGNYMISVGFSPIYLVLTP